MQKESKDFLDIFDDIDDNDRRADEPEIVIKEASEKSKEEQVKRVEKPKKAKSKKATKKRPDDGKKHLNKRTLVASVLILIVIPLTIYLGFKFGDRKYYFISLMIILYTLIPFFMIFERRKPQARELVVLAVLCAIAIAGRTIFMALPFFKPLVAIVIITGISFGGEAGFLCGAISGFVSNFIFGQGPWTPWQMFSYGIAGFLAGILFQKGWLKEKKLPLCIYGGVVTLCVVGPLLDLCALFTSGNGIEPSWSQYLVLLASGLPVNAVHAAATVIFLFILSKPMFEKLDRIKQKYGMLEYAEDEDRNIQEMLNAK